jgi:hypothetical protein
MFAMRVQCGIPVLLLALAGCTQGADPAQETYQATIGRSEQDRRMLLSGLPARERVDVYLYGIENVRPSDYALAEDLGDGQDGLAAELASRLGSADSKEAVFGLIYALHGRAGQLKVPPGATSACDRFYSLPSPCHKIAIEVDSERRAAPDPARR